MRPIPNRPMNLMARQEMAQLASDLHARQLTLYDNSYRSALQNLEQDRASEEDGRVASEAAHIKHVQAAQAQMTQSAVVFGSPTTGGLTVSDGIH